MALVEVFLEFLMLCVFALLARREAAFAKNAASVEAKVVGVDGDDVSLLFVHPSGKEVSKVFDISVLREQLSVSREEFIGQVIEAVCHIQDSDVLVPMSYEKYRKKYKCQKMPVITIILLALIFSLVHNVSGLVTG